MNILKDDSIIRLSIARGRVWVQRPIRRLRRWFPGFAVTMAATAAAAFLSEHYGAPLTPLALLVGLSLSFLQSDKRLSAGLSFATGPLLRLGVVALGARITVAQIVTLGWPALLAIIAIVTLTIIAGIVLGRRLGFGRDDGLLAGAAVAICGASAAMAFAGLLGRSRVGQAQLTLVLVAIAIMSALAMIFYPLLARLIGLNPTQAGFLFGAAIHDVAQALGAGQALSPQAADTAAIVKLSRVALLAPAMVVASYSMGLTGRGRASLRPPWFVVGFFLVTAINSAGLLNDVLVEAAQITGTIFLVCAVTATGISASIAPILQGGARAMLLIGGISLFALALATSASLLLIE